MLESFSIKLTSLERAGVTSLMGCIFLLSFDGDLNVPISEMGRLARKLPDFDEAREIGCFLAV